MLSLTLRLKLSLACLVHLDHRSLVAGLQRVLTRASNTLTRLGEQRPNDALLALLTTGQDVDVLLVLLADDDALPFRRLNRHDGIGRVRPHQRSLDTTDPLPATRGREHPGHVLVDLLNLLWAQRLRGQLGRKLSIVRATILIDGRTVSADEDSLLRLVVKRHLGEVRQTRLRRTTDSSLDVLARLQPTARDEHLRRLHRCLLGRDTQSTVILGTSDVDDVLAGDVARQVLVCLGRRAHAADAQTVARSPPLELLAAQDAETLVLLGLDLASTSTKPSDNRHRVRVQELVNLVLGDLGLCLLVGNRLVKRASVREATKLGGILVQRSGRHGVDKRLDCLRLGCGTEVCGNVRKQRCEPTKAVQLVNALLRLRLNDGPIRSEVRGRNTVGEH